MTSQKAQIESLIQEIDEVLSKTTPRLPWVMSSDAVQQRQVLEETRQYLASLQQQIGEEGTLSGASVKESAKESAPAGVMSEGVVFERSGTPMEESAQQVLQAVVQEMNYLRSNMLQPMRSDVDLLRQQRDALIQEVRQLEAQRQQYGLPGQQNQQFLMEFLQSAFRQMQENLSMQVTQMVTNLAAVPPNPALMGTAPTPMLNGADPASFSAGRLEVQTQSDQLLLKLDSTLQAIFESLQNNVQTYQDSLEQGLSRMHHLGQQGETMFSTLVTRLAEQLGREASSYLQSSISSEWQTNRPSLLGQEAEPSGDPDIARLLDELNTIDPAKPSNIIQPAPIDFQEQTDSINADLNNLDLLDLELKQIDLSAIQPEPFALPDDEMTLFQDDQAFSSLLDESVTRIQDEPEDETIEPSAPQEVTNLDSALDLLNQLSAEIQTEPFVQTEPEIPAAEAPQTTPPLVASPDNLYEDEFYQSLFGDPDVEPIAPDAVLHDQIDADITAVELPNAASEPVTFAETWFDGAAEPAIDEPVVSESEEIPVVDAPPVLKSVEDLLLNPPHLQLSIPHDANLDQPDPVSADLPQDTVSSLLELLPDSEDAAVMLSEDWLSEESFEAAQPEEDLLSETASPDTLSDLRLPADALQQLAADLSTLEDSAGLFGDEIDLAVTEDADWALPETVIQVDETPLTVFFEETIDSVDETPLTIFFEETIDPGVEPATEFNEPVQPEATSEIEDLFWESADPANFDEEDSVEFIDTIELKEPESEESEAQPNSQNETTATTESTEPSVAPVELSESDEILLEGLFEEVESAEASADPDPAAIADLFASIALEPTVTPESPQQEVPQGTIEDVFTGFPSESTPQSTSEPTPAAPLEGWDIFTEITENSDPTPPSTTSDAETWNEGKHNPPVNPASHLTTAPDSEAPKSEAPGTVDDFFSTFEAGEPEPPQPGFDQQSSTNTLSKFTLEGMEDLFGNLPPAVQPDPQPDFNEKLQFPQPPFDEQSSTNTLGKFTLEGMEDLFGNLPPIAQPDQQPDLDSEKKKI